MCGLAGILELGADPSNRVEEAMSPVSQNIVFSTLARRGPDAQGNRVDDSIWMGHRRLSIVDLDSRGNQPMERGGYVIVFNGMIYNFRDIRQELIAKGCNFTTDTDTEVVVTGWEVWKKDLLPRLQGMFAFAIWDTQKKSLTLVRDRFGKKPLFYRSWRDNFLFASRLDTIEALSETVQLDKDALSWLLTLKYIPEPFSASADIHKVPAGHLLHVTKSGQKLERWYKLQPDRQVGAMNIENQKSHLQSLMQKAVSDRLIADVPVACFLSGGIDSAIVAALARDHGPVVTFTARFDDELLDEGVAARLTADALGTHHIEVKLNANQQFDLLDRLFSGALDEPFGDSSALPALAVAQAMKAEATVALSGDGADELFGGYRKYQGEILVSAWQRLPSLVRNILKAVIGFLPAGRGNRMQELFRQAQRFAKAADLNAVERHAVWMEMITIDDEIMLGLPGHKHKELVSLLQQIQFMPEVDRLSATLLRDIYIVLSSDMLVKVDRTSMEFGVEVRSPFLDHRVAEASLAIDGRNKIAWKQGKKILRDSFQKKLPAHLLHQPKKGFELPLNKWLSGPLQDRLGQALSKDFLAYNNFNPNLGENLLQAIKADSLPHAELGWTLMSFHAWQANRNFI